MKRIALTAFTLLLCIAVLPNEANAQRKKKKNKGKSEEAAPKGGKLDKSYKEITGKSSKSEGLFVMYRDTVSGKSYLELDANQLGKEYIYFSAVRDGVLDAGFFRGAYRGSKVVSFERDYNTIDVYHQNTAYYYDPNSPMAKAGSANINVPLLASLSIEGISKDKSKILVSGDALFLSENFSMIKPPSRPGRSGMLGRLSKDKTRLKDIKNYPENTDIIVNYVYDNANPQRGGSAAVTDVRYITVAYQHSLLAMPDNGFEARQDDHRVGYFMTQVNDMTSFDVTPYRDMIHRWRLVKKDPSAAVSEPVEPITWWVENTTPEEFRPIIQAGVERWNTAFEKAGFKNAVVCKIQPDDADWDAGDIRYNVLRWTSSPQPPFGGYGPSFVNPRTGEILGADIMLEFASVRNRLFREDIFSKASIIHDEHFADETEEGMFCLAGEHMSHNLQFGMAAIRAMGMDQAAEKDFVKQTLYRLALHEVGHTLGLTHNMRASTMQSVENIKNKALIEKEGLCNSVMEYPSINFALNPEEQTVFYDSEPGPYDDWVIAYGYSQEDGSSEEEQARLDKLLSKSTDPKLAYGNDADDMRASGRGMDPDVNIYDLSSDPVAYAIDRMELVKKVLPTLQEQYTKDGDSYQALLNAYYSVTGEYATQVRIISRQIGGVHYDRAQPEQGSEKMPLQPVSEEEQRAAMKALAEYAFAPDVLEAPEGMMNYLLEQRRGFNHYGRDLSPNVLDRMLNMQSQVIAHVIHPNTTKRILNSETIGNTYDLGEMMTDLSDAIFKADLRTKVNPQRQALQVFYVEQLLAAIGEKSKHDRVSQGMITFELQRIKKQMASASKSDKLTAAHRAHIQHLIEEGMKS